PMATSGAQGLVAIARTALGRRAVTTGSIFSLPAAGIGGGPSGRPFTADFRPVSVVLGITTTLLPEICRALCSIHSFMVLSCGCAILVAEGGILGSSMCAESV